MSYGVLKGNCSIRMILLVNPLLDCKVPYFNEIRRLTLDQP